MGKSLMPKRNEAAKSYDVRTIIAPLAQEPARAIIRMGDEQRPGPRMDHLHFASDIEPSRSY